MSSTKETVEVNSELMKRIAVLFEGLANLKVLDEEQEKLEFEQAARTGCVEAMRKLIANGVHQRQENGNMALMLACQGGQAGIVKILLDAGVNPRIPMNDGLDALFIACHNGHVQVVELLVNNKEFSEWVNRRSYLGRTPLVAACIQGHLAIVQILLKAGADMTLTTMKESVTPLHAACDNKRVEIITFLLDQKNAKEIINAQNCSGFTPLMCVAGIDDQPLSVQIADMLLKNGAQINSVSHSGATAFIIACSRGNLLLTELLYEKGASLIAQAVDGTTALSIARARGHAHVVKFLLNKEPSRKDAAERSDSDSPKSASEKIGKELRDAESSHRINVKVSHDIPNTMDGISWKTISDSVSFTRDNRTFEGSMYTTTATGGRAALIMTNSGNAEPGELRVGIRFPDRHILTLAKIYKTRGHDFYLARATGSECTDPPSIYYGVFRTPQANYSDDPAFGFAVRRLKLNCEEEDVWVENPQGLERTHSPEPNR